MDFKLLIYNIRTMVSKIPAIAVVMFASAFVVTLAYEAASDGYLGNASKLVEVLHQEGDFSAKLSSIVSLQEFDDVDEQILASVPNNKYEQFKPSKEDSIARDIETNPAINNDNISQDPSNEGTNTVRNITRYVGGGSSFASNSNSASSTNNSPNLLASRSNNATTSGLSNSASNTDTSSGDSKTSTDDTNQVSEELNSSDSSYFDQLAEFQDQARQSACAWWLESGTPFSQLSSREQTLLTQLRCI